MNRKVEIRKKLFNNERFVNLKIEFLEKLIINKSLLGI